MPFENLPKAGTQGASAPLDLGAPKTSGTAYDYLGGFTASSVEGLGEVFGMEPSKTVKDFRSENPLGGVVSQLVGFGVPYLGWEAAALKIPRVMGAATRAEAAISNPFMAGAARETVKLLPFEVGRQLANQAIGDQSIGDMLADNALSLAGGGLVGGAINTLRRGARTLESLEGFVDLEKPTQFQLRQLQELDPSLLDDVQLNRVNKGIIDLRKEIRLESKSGTTIDSPLGGEGKAQAAQYVGDLGNKETTRLVNRLFKGGRKLDASAWGDDLGWQSELGKAGVDPKGFEAWVKYPRIYTLPEKGGWQRGVLSKGLAKVSDDTHISREANDGLYVVAKRYKVDEAGGLDEMGLPSGPRTRDRVLLFKTDSPDRFAPVEAKWTIDQDRISAWDKDLELDLGKSKLYDTAVKTMGQVAGLKADTKTKNAIVDGMAKATDKFLNPRQMQLRSSALGRTMLATMEATFDLAATRAKTLTFGTRGIDPAKAQLAQLLTGAFRLEGTSVKSLADKVKDWDAVSSALTQELPLEAVKDLYLSGRISQEGWELLQHMDTVGKLVDEGEILPLQKITGITKYRQREGHYGVPRTREGDYRVQVLDENGNTLHLVGAKSQREAVALADKVIRSAKETADRTWARSEPFLREQSVERELLDEYSSFRQGPSADQALARNLFQKQLRSVPGSKNFRERTNVEGFQTEWDAEKLTDAFGRHLENKLRYAASLATRQAIGQHSDKLRVISGAHAFDVVARRLQDFEGIQGPISRAVNEATDKVLGPILGKGSATKIASAVNKGYMHLALGAGNLAYPVTNMIGFLQTTLPQVAFLASAPPERLARYYGAGVAQARGGVRGIGYLDALKLASQGAKQLASKDPEWLKMVNRAANDGTLEPRFAEEYIGQHAEKLLNFRENAKSPLGWAKSIQGLSALGMESGERLSRAHSLSIAFRVGKDFFGWEGDQLYQFMKQFSDRTMYRYAVPDRPTLFAGPVGSTFGLFKNWMMHYTMWMAEHAGMVAQNPGSMAAWKPLLWQIGGTAAVGGIGAWPFFSLMDSFAKWTSDKSMMENVYSQFGGQGPGEGDTLADGIYYGLPSLLGLSLGSQVEMPFSAPMSDAEFMMTPAHWYRMQALGKAIGDSADRFTATGQFNPLSGEALSLGWAQALAPKTIYRALQTQTDDVIRSGRTGEPLVKLSGTLDRIGYVLGLNPTEVDRMYEVSAGLWEEKEKRNRVVQALGQEWKEAQDMGDFAAVNDVMRRSMLMGIDVSRVVRSAQSRLQREQSDMLESNFKPEVLWQNRHAIPGGE